MSALNVAAMMGTAKSLAAVAKEAGKIELYQQVLELQQDMMQAIAENTRLTSQNAELSRRVIELEHKLDEANKTLAKQSQMRFRDGMYWREDGSDNVDGPFCPKCLDADGKTVRMVDPASGGYSACVNCGYSHRNADHPDNREPSFDSIEGDCDSIGYDDEYF